MEMELKVAQNQSLTPQMELSVRILQMDALQLAEYLREVTLENPVIEMESPAEPENEGQLALRKLQWLENQTRREKENVGYYDADDDRMIEKNAAAEEESLTDHLLTQARLTAEPEFFPTVRFVIGCLDENGYLTIGESEIARESGISPAQISRALALVRTFDPAGVGAHGLGDCLCLQLSQGETLARTLAGQYLCEVAKNQANRLACKLNVSCEEIEAAVKRIRQLNPKPGSLYNRAALPSYITPDVVVTNFEDRYHVLLCQFNCPEIRISDTYLRMARETTDKELLEYIEKKMNQVSWIKKCIENRDKTLLSVAKEIVKRQERFFRHGPQYLSILRMRDIADTLELHESTVSRAVRDKYLQCSHGVYPLRYFFVKSACGTGGETSSHTVKCLLKKLIEQEDPTHPYNDQQLADLLAAEGAAISRRTVAKYREELGFPRASER